MASRAVVTCSTATDVANSNDIGVYLHWDGDPTHMNAFLAYCEAKKYRSPDTDFYGWARFCQVVGNYFGRDLIIGIGACRDLDCDNHNWGTYIVNGWKVVERRYAQSTDHDWAWRADLWNVLEAVNEAQPKKEQLHRTDLIEVCRRRGWFEG